MVLGKSQSVPGLMKMGTTMPKGDQHQRKATLSYRVAGQVDLQGSGPAGDDIKAMANALRQPSWRLQESMSNPNIEPAPVLLEDVVPKNMRHPRVAPAWMKHDKQVLRFYAFFQENVSESPEENSRYRNVSIMFYMEDGTIRISEPRVENSGIPQGCFLKRHRVPKAEGGGFLGPDDFRIGEDIEIYGRIYHVSGCDRFTRWFYDENGINLGDDEPLMQDAWQRSYKFKKTAEKGGIPATRSAMDAKLLGKLQVGAPITDHALQQFLLNDRKVLRFKGFWDDPTLYGARVYFIIHYFLADNTVEINEAHCRNSGRDNYPSFMKRGPMYKKNSVSAYPGMLSSDADLYLPEDFILGQSISVWNRKVVLYDCDDFTQKFYEDYMDIDQSQGKIDVSERPVVHRKLHPPPHNGVGKEEDSILSCQYIQPKAPKVDLVKLMTLSGEVLRFECKMVNGEPEDECRRLVIAFYPMDDCTAVFEIPQRNSGHMGGKFADKRRIKNPATGKYFALNDFFVGQTVNIAAQPLHIIRADEHCLQFLEARPDEFPWADPIAIIGKLAACAGCPEMRDDAGIDPDRVKELAAENGVELVDHEVITLLRNFAVDNETPRLSGPRILKALGA